MVNNLRISYFTRKLVLKYATAEAEAQNPDQNHNDIEVAARRAIRRRADPETDDGHWQNEPIGPAKKGEKGKGNK